ncbi:hypothetical protein LINPERHAP2_LOCUS37895, partial [Linum perenne]
HRTLLSDGVGAPTECYGELRGIDLVAQSFEFPREKSERRDIQVAVKYKDDLTWLSPERKQKERATCRRESASPAVIEAVSEVLFWVCRTIQLSFNRCYELLSRIRVVARENSL